MRHPFQCIQTCSSPSAPEDTFLVAACGPRLHVFSLKLQQRLVSTWSSNDALQSRQNIPANAVKYHTEANENQSLLIAGEELGPSHLIKSSVTDPLEAHDAERASQPEPTTSEAQSKGGKIIPNIIHLQISSNGSYVVAVTGDDKCIRVFELLPGGGLLPLSQRCMPKRPCAVKIASDNHSIFVADKFGDVYSLPLRPLSVNGSSSNAACASRESIPSSSIRRLVWSASEKTVHTGRNQQALRNQQRQQEAEVGRASDRKEEPNFEHSLLLGHASMLTDLVLTREPSGTMQGNYIVTCDRDEHIRISRGPPQTHVIRGYCLGHREFVSRLCVPSWRTDLLISGGGDDFLCVWDWALGTLKERVSLLDVAATYVASTRQPDADHLSGSTGVGAGVTLAPKEVGNMGERAKKLAVAGIWDMALSPRSMPSSKGLILVAVEGISALFAFHSTADGNLIHDQTLALPGNALDVATCASDSMFYVSCDSCHRPCSINEMAHRSAGNEALLVRFKVSSNETPSVKSLVAEEAWSMEPMLVGASFDVPSTGLSAFGDFLYGVEKLRKRGSDEL